MALQTQVEERFGLELSAIFHHHGEWRDSIVNIADIEYYCCEMA